jgi:hypothetical protein
MRPESSDPLRTDHRRNLGCRLLAQHDRGRTLTRPHRSMHGEAAGSADLHLFQELSTLDQPLTRTLLLRQGLDRIKPMFPARTPRPRQAFGGARSGTGTTVHTAPLQDSPYPSPKSSAPSAGQARAAARNENSNPRASDAGGKQETQSDPEMVINLDT